ncbi:MAG: ribosomal-protein-alanine N-acetyltransferase [Planctomycetota bacterium]|jgi:[ribosomal protein S18]-alanine N-acetyltransferase
MSAVLSQAMLVFRPMVEDDLESIMRVELAAYEYPWSEAIFRDCLRVGYCCWILESDDDFIAYGVMSVGGGESHILNLCVRPDYQNNGMGKEMLNHLMEIARHHNAQTVFLEVRPTNEVAIKLYNTAGFNEIGIRENYYPSDSGKEDALIMARNLS